MKPDGIFLHKLDLLFENITQSYEGSGGYYVEQNGQWYRLSLNQVDQKTADRIEENIAELHSS